MADPALAAMETNGIRANKRKEFTVLLTGEEVYEYLDLLQRVAVENTSFMTVRQAVLLAEKMRVQARQQGF